MLKNRRPPFLGSIAILILCSGMAASQPPSPSPSEAAQPEQPKAAEPQQPANANQGPATAPPIIVNVTAAPKTESEKHEEAREREEKAKLDGRLIELTGDLAFFTAALFYATAALVFATVVLGLIGIFQLRDTKKSVRATEDAAKAAAKSANIAEEAFRRLERPYLLVKFDTTSTHMLRVVGQPPSIPYLIFRLVNSGKMPAILRSYAVELEAGPALPLRIPMDRNIAAYEIIEPSKLSDEFPRLYVKGGEVGKPWLGKEATKLIFHGIYSYEDPTGARHTDRFCMRATEYSKTFVFEGGDEYNWHETEYPQPRPHRSRGDPRD